MRVAEDIRALTDRIAAEHPGKPIFLFGHSMGSLIGRVLIQREGDRYRAAVLTGVFIDKPVRRYLTAWIASLLGFGRMEKPCKALNDLSFKEYNKPFEGRTEFDWLSSRTGEVDRYVADPRCGFVCTAALYRDIGIMLADSLWSRSIARVPDSLPILFMAGGMDSLGGRKAVDMLVSTWKKHGKNVSGKIYENSRHEVLGDVDEEAMTADVIEFYKGCPEDGSGDS